MLCTIIGLFSACKHWCTEPCLELSGDVRQECGDCEDAASRCRPGQPDFDAPAVHAQVSVGSDGGVGTVPSACRELDASALRDGAPLRWRKPTIVRRPLEYAPSDVWNTSRPELLSRIGTTAYTSGPALDAELGFFPDMRAHIEQSANSAAVTLHELVGRHVGNRTKTFFTYHPALNDAMVPALDAMPALRRHGRLTRRAVSLGERYQFTEMHRHNTAVFVQMRGSKGWALAPPHVPDALRAVSELAQTHLSREYGDDDYHLSGRLLCDWFARGASEEGGAAGAPSAGERDLEAAFAALAARQLTRCVLREGDAIVVPKQFWHGTCNLDEWNTGFTWFFDV